MLSQYNDFRRLWWYDSTSWWIWSLMPPIFMSFYPGIIFPTQRCIKVFIRHGGFLTIPHKYNILRLKNTQHKYNFLRFWLLFCFLCWRWSLYLAFIPIPHWSFLCVFFTLVWVNEQRHIQNPAEHLRWSFFAKTVSDLNR